jgi:hypothetical protein
MRYEFHILPFSLVKSSFSVLSMSISTIVTSQQEGRAEVLDTILR